MPNDLSIAAALGALLRERKQTLAVAESSAGGLISATLLAVPGASAYFVGGGVIYTQAARAVRAGALFGRDYGIKAVLATGERPSSPPAKGDTIAPGRIIDATVGDNERVRRAAGGSDADEP